MFEEALREAMEKLSAVFAAKQIRHALIGGLAVGVRGRPRATKDADFIVSIPALTFPGLLEALVDEEFEIDVMDTVRRWSVEQFTVFYRGKARIDWMQPILPLYNRVLTDASPLPWIKGASPINVATTEGIILTKLVAFRPQDQTDIEMLLAANRDTIDLATIREVWTPIAASYQDRTAWLEGLVTKYGIA